MKAILVLMAVTHGNFTQVPFDTVEQCEAQRAVIQQTMPEMAAVCVRLDSEPRSLTAEDHGLGAEEADELEQFLQDLELRLEERRSPSD